MGTRVAVGCQAWRRRSAQAACDRALAEIGRLESVFSIFDPSAELSLVRRGKLDRPGAELAAVIEAGKRWTQVTRGAYCSTVDPLRDLWAQADRDDRIPAGEQVRAAVRAAAGGEPRHLNLNAIAKGWSVDRALDAALTRMSRSATSAWINAGGDVAHRGAGSVTVGIEDPKMPFDNVEARWTVRVSNQALATSGGARRFHAIGGRHFGHVIDPRNGWPVDHVAQASVLAPTAEAADVWATAATVLQVDESIDRLGTEPQTEALIVTANGEVATTPNWPDASAA